MTEPIPPSLFDELYGVPSFFADNFWLAIQSHELCRVGIRDGIKLRSVFVIPISDLERFSAALQELLAQHRLRECTGGEPIGLQ